MDLKRCSGHNVVLGLVPKDLGPEAFWFPLELHIVIFTGACLRLLLRGLGISHMELVKIENYMIERKRPFININQRNLNLDKSCLFCVWLRLAGYSTPEELKISL